MIRVACPSCQTKYRFDESQLGGKARGKAKCQKCGATIEIGAAEADATVAGTQVSDGAQVDNESSQDTTARMRRMRSDEDVGGQTVTAGDVHSVLDLPPDKKYSLAVLQGKASGQIFNILRTRTTIGRGTCDITLDDAECSREHAVIEILGARVIVRDLGSTNGTFVDGSRIEQSELENHNEFRIGDHVLMLIVTDRE